LYRLYFHPLRRYSGPKLSAISYLPLSIAQATGRIHEYVDECHKKYGDAVRIAPDEISFIDPLAWKDINGHVTKANQSVMPHKRFVAQVHVVERLEELKFYYMHALSHYLLEYYLTII